jgi:hypothetical protein
LTNGVVLGAPKTPLRLVSFSVKSRSGAPVEHQHRRPLSG